MYSNFIWNRMRLFICKNPDSGSSHKNPSKIKPNRKHKWKDNFSETERARSIFHRFMGRAGHPRHRFALTRHSISFTVQYMLMFQPIFVHNNVPEYAIQLFSSGKFCKVYIMFVSRKTVNKVCTVYRMFVNKKTVNNYVQCTECL